MSFVYSTLVLTRSCIYIHGWFNSVCWCVWIFRNCDAIFFLVIIHANRKCTNQIFDHDILYIITAVYAARMFQRNFKRPFLGPSNSNKVRAIEMSKSERKRAYENNLLIYLCMYFVSLARTHTQAKWHKNSSVEQIMWDVEEKNWERERERERREWILFYTSEQCYWSLILYDFVTQAQ